MTFPNKLNAIASAGIRAALESSGDDASVFLLRSDQLVTFPQLMGHGFFQIGILAGLHRVDGMQGVPVVGAGDDDGVDVRPFQQSAVVLELGHPAGVEALVGEVFGKGFHPGGIWITKRDDCHVLDLEKLCGNAVGSTAAADDADAHRVVGAFPVDGPGQGGETTNFYQVSPGNDVYLGFLVHKSAVFT